MSIMQSLKSPTKLGRVEIEGKNRNEDIGYKIFVPEGGHTQIDEIVFHNCFINLIKLGPGQLTIGRLVGNEFGGDNINGRASNMRIEETVVRNNTPTRPYDVCIREGSESIEECLARHREIVFDTSLLKFIEHPKFPGKEVIASYHVDGVAQFYAVKPDGYTVDPSGEISNIIMPSVDAVIRGKNSQAFIFSEADNATNIHIGYKKYRVLLPDGYKYHAIFNQLSNSIIGCANAEVSPGTSIRIKTVKETEFCSGGNVLVGFGEHIECDGEHYIAPQLSSSVQKEADRSTMSVPTDKALVKKPTDSRNISENPTRGKSMFDFNTFLLAISATMFNGTVKPHQTEGMEHQLHYFENNMMGYPVEYLAYGLATTYHECAGRMHSIKEMGSNSYFKRMYDINGKRPQKALELGNDKPGDGAKYCARGCAGVTGKTNYQKHGDKFGVDLVNNPDLLLQDHALSVAVMYQGMLDGDFTGKKLDDYWTDPDKFDAVGARRIINGRDKKDLIAGYYQHFLVALNEAKTVKQDGEVKFQSDEVVYITPEDEMPSESLSAEAFQQQVDDQFKASKASSVTDEPIDIDFDQYEKPTKPWYKSKITQTAGVLLGGAISAVSARHGYDVPADIVLDVLAGGTGIGAVAVGVFRTWFTRQAIQGTGTNWLNKTK